MTEKWEISSIDTEEVEKNSKLTLDGGFDFNSGWNFIYRNQVGLTSMEDESLVPPANFKFFYKETNFPFKGDLSVCLDDYRCDMEVPYSISKSGDFRGQIYDVYDLLGEHLKNADTTKKYSSFLNNLVVFTTPYSRRSGIIDVFGSYVSRRS